jgi:arginase
MGGGQALWTDALVSMVPTPSEEIELCKPSIVGFPYDGNSSFLRGAAAAPPLIRKAFFSASSNLWTESGIDLAQSSILFDAGDVTPVPGSEIMTAVGDSIATLLDRNLRPLSLGGDHSITYPIVRALSKHYPRLSVLYVDAHPDLYDEFSSNRNSHACVCARIMEEKLVSRLVQVGIRTLNGHQAKQALRFGVEIYEMRDWRDNLKFNFNNPIYISIDLDGLDPAYAPGVSHREPGGLSTRQVIELIQKLDQPIVGADIVEFNPAMDAHGTTAMVCAKLLKEIAAKMLGER